MRAHSSSLAALVAAVSVVAIVAAGLAAPAEAKRGRSKLYDTFLLSRTFTGDWPNGPSSNATISQDGRVGRAVAYQSDASNIVPGDANGLTDVIVVERASPYSRTGSTWRNGRTRIASTGLGGQPANGRSYGPAIDGRPRGPRPIAPQCVAFVSDASNLVPDDTNGRPDAFVFSLRTGSVRRVSVSTGGAQSDGSTYDVAVDGTCTRVAFTSNASNLAQTSGGGKRRPNFASVRTGAPPAGTKQVYVRVIGTDRASDRGLRGLSFLASASSGGNPGNANSSDPSWSIRTKEVLAFTSRASNLAGRDENRTTDVYVRKMKRVVRYFGRRGSRRKLATLASRTRLVSAKASGKAGNGSSSQPSASDQGYFVTYQTKASDLIPRDRNTVTDIARADLRGRRIGTKAVSRQRGRIGNGPSFNPQSAAGGYYAVFDSSSTTFRPTAAAKRDRNGARDVFLYTDVRNLVTNHSADTSNRPLRLPSRNAASSARANYLLFETSDPFADVRRARRLHPDWFVDPLATLASARSNPAFNQIFMRYLGPRDL